MEYLVKKQLADHEERIKKLEVKYEDIISRIEKIKGNSPDVKPDSPNREKRSNPEPNFSINVRTFVKRYVAPKSGPKRFTYLLAYMTEGNINMDVRLDNVRKNWNKMSAKDLLGKFNQIYPNRAIINGWVDSKDRGIYHLTKDWKNIYEK